MLHSCSQCRTIYLVSDFRNLCNLCGSELQRAIERASENDGEIEWVALLSWAANGEQPLRRRRWKIR